jgi:hypothetical protein
MEQQPKSVPQPAEGVIFLSGGSLTLRTEGQTPWGQFPASVVAGQVVVGTTYTWTGEGSWRAVLPGQGGGSAASPAAGEADARGGDAEQGRVS